MKLSIKAGATSQTINVFIQDSSSTVGAGLTGLAYNTGSLVCYYALPRAAPVAVTLVTQTVTGAYATAAGGAGGGFVELSSANMPGWYRLDLPDAALASGRFVCLHLKGAANMAPCPIEIELTGWDNQLVPGAAGGLLISGSNAGTTTFGALTVTGATTFTGATTHTGNVSMAAGLTITQSTTNGHGITATGNGTGAGFNIAAGATGKGIAIATTAGDGLSILPTAGHAIVATGQGTSKHGMLLTGAAAGTSDGLSCVAASGAAIRGTRIGDLTGNVSGSIGSVTGAVNSVATDVGITQAAANKVWATPRTANRVSGTFGEALPDGAAAASGGLIVSGASNGGTTTFANLTVTGTITGNLSGSVGSVTNDVGITQAGADKVWGTAARTLTAGTNIALAKGVGVTGFNDIAATDVWAAGTRTLTAGTNITLAKTTNITGFNDITAASVWGVARTANRTSGTFGEALPDAASGAAGGLPLGDASGKVLLQPTQSGVTIPTVTSVTNAVTAGTVSDKTGYSLVSSGLDAVVVETGVNARQALSVVMASTAGVLSGAGTGEITVKGGNVATTRMVATTDTNGNRSVVTLTLPT